MELADNIGSAGIAGAHRPLKRLRTVLQVLDVGIAGKTTGWHRGLPFRGPVATCALSGS
jgi:hypothetical protein